MKSIERFLTYLLSIVRCEPSKITKRFLPAFFAWYIAVSASLINASGESVNAVCTAIPMLAEQQTLGSSTTLVSLDRMRLAMHW